MPLHDHFHGRVKAQLPWQSLLAAWATRIADVLNDRYLTQRFLATEHVRFGPSVEIDVSGLESPPVPPTESIPISFSPWIEIQVHADGGGWNLVGAIELIAPGNKDGSAERTAFAAKCVAYLHQGIS